MLDCSQLTYAQMADIIRAIWLEVKRRNPIGVNAYARSMMSALESMTEIADAEADNFTSEHGPIEPRPKR